MTRTDILIIRGEAESPRQQLTIKLIKSITQLCFAKPLIGCRESKRKEEKS